MALVGIPRAPGGQVRQAQDGREDHQADRDECRSPATDGHAWRRGRHSPASGAVRPAARIARPAARHRHRLGRQVGQGAPGGDVVCPGQVHRVVALVHPGCLEVVRDPRQQGMAEQMAETVGPDPAGTQMLMAVEV